MDGACTRESGVAGRDVVGVPRAAFAAAHLPGVVALRLEGEGLFEQASARFGIGVGAHAVEALECELPRDLRVICGQRFVVSLHGCDLEPEALRVLEAETGVGALGRDVLGGESLLPEGERFVGADA
jgi:hypothetical protein